MTRTEINNSIDSNITNQTLPNSITPAIDGQNRKEMLDYVDEKINEIELLEGPQGIQGIQGVAGPVGPAGLNWQGQWVSGTSYIEDDAVGFDGASWFCILATSGTTNPDVDTTHWALLASQGAQGPQGIQGEAGAQGIQGPQGIAGEGLTPQTNGALSINSTTQVLPYDINFLTGNGNGFCALPETTQLGKKIIVLGGPNNTTIFASTTGSSTIRLANNTSLNRVIIDSRDIYEFTLLSSISDTRIWFAEKIQPVEREVVFSLFQEGTNAPIAQPSVKDNFTFQPISGPVGRSYAFSRINVGEYTIQVRWNPTTHPTNVNNLAVFFGDSTVRFEGGVTNGSTVNFDFKQWGFSTYNSAGVKSDNMLLGSNGGFFTIKQYTNSF